jgi:hypothetical protein
MPENIYERIHTTLTWKRIVGFNIGLFLLLIVPISVRLAQQDTENRSGAAGEVVTPVVTPPPSYPSVPPSISRVVTFFGKPGDTIVILGSNFGDYQWGSRVFVGSSEALTDSIVRWSNTVLEVKIPETAKTGKVSVSINGQSAVWEGSLLLYDVARSAQVGVTKVASGEVRAYVTNGSSISSGMIELSYVSEPVSISPGPNITVTEQSQSADALGKKMKVQFSVNTPLTSAQTMLFTANYPGIGQIEILRTEFFDQNQSLIPVYADPLNLKSLP